jgi:hypothetical protein
MKEEMETNLKEETKRPFCCFLRVENFSFPSKSNIAQKKSNGFVRRKRPSTQMLSFFLRYLKKLK